ncbi:MAG: leucyl aminopeptidase [Myxococcales bacterium]|nr:leucyl aminopeptidase [Myxococcales bacterium]
MALHIQTASGDPTTAAVDLIAVLVTEGGLDKQKVVADLDRALGGALLENAKLAEFTGKPDQSLDLPTMGRLKARRVLLLGVGAKRAHEPARLRAAAATAARAAQGAKAKSLGFALPVEGIDLRVIAEGIGLGAYRFTKYMTGDRLPKAELKDVKLFVHKQAQADKAAIDIGLKIAEAICLTRDAVNEPPNELNPEALARIARGLAKKHGMGIKVLDKKGIAAAGMKLHYAVAQGSANEPRFIHLSYVPKKPKKKLVFVGKGLTFDSGGLCIKPAPGMGEMKSDMSGAGVVLGLMAAVAALRPNVEVHGIVGAAENMPDAEAYRPGDIFGSLDGKTVEIVNTDAEGRLVLADALTYASRLNPDLLVDAATLTGACMVALGKTCSGFYSVEDKHARELEAAAKEAGEQFWRMPLIEDMREQLKSDVADLKHTADRWGGSISAALFLREFVGKAPWIHCDIAGPVLGDAAKGTYPKGATGHAVLTFLKMIEHAAR